MDARLSSRSLILVLLMLFAVFTPALSPYEPPKEVLDEVEDETMKTGSGPIDVLDNVGDWRFGTTGEQKNYAIETTSGPNPITYIAGEYQNSISIGGISLSGSANSDGYIAAIDSDDSFSWAARVGGSGTNSVMGMDVGDAEEILVTGKFSGTAFFYNESSSTPAFSRTSQGGSDVFVGMLSDDGKWEWVATAGSSIDDQGVDVEIGVYGVIFHVTGRIGNNTNFYDSGDSTSWQFPASITNGGLDVFAASLNGSGGWSWAYAGGGSGLESGAEIVEYSNPWNGVLGGLYLCGKSESQGGATFGVHNVTFDSSTNNGVEDFFIAKVGYYGWEWASSGIGGGDTSCKDLAISSNGSSLAMTGSYRNSISYFDSRPWASAISVGAHYTCGIKDTGAATCWGYGAGGRLGNGGTANSDVPDLVDLPNGRTALEMSAGGHSCAVLDNGSAMCWGKGDYGRLGNGGTTASSTPVYVDLPAGRTAKTISSGYHHSCAVLDNGSAMCWGLGEDGQLGNGFYNNESTPVFVSLPAGRSATSITGGHSHTCAILDNGSAMCWGDGGKGELGNGAATNSNVPVFVNLPSGRTMTEISAGQDFSCGLLDNHSVMCWGSDDSGRLGNGESTTSSQSNPVYSAGSGYHSYLSITTGNQHACAINSDGDVHCWGENGNGQLGSGDTNDEPNWIDSTLPAGSYAVAVDGGDIHTCAILNNAEPYCWGYNWAGQLGNGGADNYSDQLEPVAVSGSPSMGAQYTTRAGSCSTSSSTTTDTILVMQIDTSDGGFDWCSSSESTVSGSQGKDITYDPTGNLTVTGAMKGTVTFTEATQNTLLTSTGNADAFLAGFSSSTGFVQWAKKSAWGSEDVIANEVLYDDNGHILLGGFFAGSMWSSGGAGQSSGGNDVWVARMAYAKEGCFIDGTDTNTATEWTNCVGTSKGSIDPQGVVVDPSTGLSYHTGTFQGTAVFGNHVLVSPMDSGTNVFVAAINSTGVWQWAASGGGENNEYARGIGLDSSGYLYVAGYYYDNTTFGAVTLTGDDSANTFVAKIAPSNRVWQWAASTSGTSGNSVEGFAVDSSGNSYITGGFSGTTSFGSTQSLTTNGQSDIYVAKLTSGGTWSWAKNAGSNLPDKGYGVAVDEATGSVYVTGSFMDDANFGSTSLTSAGGSDIFFAKLSSSGTWAWAKEAGSTSSDYGYDVVVDNATGKPIFTGYYAGSATFGSNSFSGSGSYTTFVVKMSASGAWDWITTTSGTSAGESITLGAAGSVFITGKLSGSATFGSDSISSTGGWDIWLGEVNATGSWVWAQNGGSTGSDYGRAIDSLVVSGSEYVWVSGSFEGEATFGQQTVESVRGNSAVFSRIKMTGADGEQSAANGTIDADLWWNSAANRLEGSWDATNLTFSPSYTYYFEWELTYQSNGSLFDNDQGDFTPTSATHNSAVRVWYASTLVEGESYCYQVYLRKDSASGTLLDSDSSCYVVPVQLLSPDWTSSNSLDTRSVACGDVDGDGDLDLVVGNYNGNNEVYLNSGTALATTPAWTSSNSLSTFSVAWGDVDGDGDLDLAVGNHNGNNEVYLNSGTALATTPVWTSSNSLYTYSVAWGDVDGDGDLDLAVGNNGGNEVYLNSGTALATTPAWTSSNSLYTYSVAWGDVDGDGGLDLAVGNFGETNEVYLNQFDNGGAVADYGEITVTLSYNESSEELEFWLSASEITPNAYYNISWSFYEDALGDPSYVSGNSGFVTSSDSWADSWEYSLDSPLFGNGGVSPGDTVCFSAALYLGAIDDSIFSEDDGPFDEECITIPEGTSGNLSSTPFWQSQETDGINTLEWGDIDEDGDLDLVACTTSGDILVYLQGQTSLTLDERIQASDTGGRASCQLVDIDADGDLDIGVAIWGNNASIYKNDATGSFSHFDSFGENTINKAYTSISFADMNHDGYPDAFLTRWAESDHLFWNYNGVGEFQEDSDWASESTNKGEDSAWGDFDDDGDMDIAVANDGAGIEVYYNTGSSLPQAHSWVTSTMTTWDVDWVDIDLDGDLDLIAGVLGKDLVYSNDNNVLSSTSIELVGDVTRRTQSLDYGDVDGDGDLDIVTAGDDNNIELYLNELTSVQSKWVLEHGSFVVALGDVDGDGDLDLAVGGYSNGPTKIFLNDWDNGGAGADGLPDLEGSDDTGSDEPDGCQLPDNTVSLWNDGVDRLYILYNFNFVLDSFVIEPVPSQSIDYDDDTIVGGEWIDAGHVSLIYGAAGLISGVSDEFSAFDGTCGTLLVIELDMNPGDQFPNNLSLDFDENAGFFDASGTKMSVTFQEWSDPPSLHSEMTWDAGNQEFDVHVDIYDLDTSETYNFDWELWVFEGQQITSGSSTIGSGTPSPAEMVYSFQDSDYSFNNGTDYCFWMQLELGGNDLVSDEVCARFPGSGGAGGSNVSWEFYDYCYFDAFRMNEGDEDGLYWCGEDEDEADDWMAAWWWYWCEGTPEGTYRCTDAYGHGNQPGNNTGDNGTGNQTQQEPNPTLNVEFKEESDNYFRNMCVEDEMSCVDDNVWVQTIKIELEDSWIGYNHSVSIKLYDAEDNTLFSYFSPIDDADGWKYIGEESTYSGLSIELAHEDTWEFWQGSTRYVTIMESNGPQIYEIPYFEAGEYCVEISLGYQINSTDTPMGSVKNLFDKEVFCGTFEHDAFEGIIWDGMEEEEKGLVDRLTANPIVSKILEFMESTTGQIVSILLGVLAFAGRMVLARGQRAKNKRVRKFAQRIRKAETVGRLKIIEQDVDKANDKNKLPRGGYGDLMEQIEARLEKLGFDENPQDGGTSGDWSSNDGADEWQDDFQQAADMMWETQDMMADAREDASMARQAIEDMQQQLGLDGRYGSEPEPEKKRYERTGLRLSDTSKSAGPSLPSSKFGGGGSPRADDLVSSILSKNIAPKEPCHCGSKKMYKDCHMKRDKARRGRR